MTDNATNREELTKASAVLVAAGFAVLSLEEFDRLNAAAGDGAVTRGWILGVLAKMRAEIVADLSGHARPDGDGVVVPAAELERRRAEKSGDATPAPEPRWMTIKAYAAARSISERTIHEYLKAGMPSVGAGRMRRIVVFAANEWIRKNAGKRADHG